MRCVNDGAWPDLGLAFQEGQEVAPGQEIQVHGNLVEEEERPGTNKAHGELDTTPFSIADGVHTPPEIDVENLNEFVPPIWVVVATYGAEERGHVDVGADDRVENPFETEVGYPLEAFFEGIYAADGDGGGGGETFAREET